MSEQQPIPSVAHGDLESGEPGTETGSLSEAGSSFQREGRRPRRWPYAVTIAILVGGLLALGMGYAYSTDTAEQWRSTAEKTSHDLASMTAERDGFAQKNKTLTSQLGDTTSKLNDTTAQLNTANDRIRSLANEKAQAGDTAALFAELVGASQKVSRELSACISDLQKLQTYLVNYSAYDQTSLLTYVRGINSECDKARSDSDSLTRYIQGLGK